MREPRADQRLTQRLLAEPDSHPARCTWSLGSDQSVNATPWVSGRARATDTIRSRWRGLLRAPAPIVRVQRREPLVVERVNHLAHMRLIAADHRRDLRRWHAGRGRQQDHRSPSLGLIHRALGNRLQPRAFFRREFTHEHFRRTHHHLQARGHTSHSPSKAYFRSNARSPRRRSSPPRSNVTRG